ncbi:hypothetical protein ACLB2K_066579 [Fragaria x ananassa]
MVEEVSRMKAALTIKENGQVSFRVAEKSVISRQCFAVGRLLGKKLSDLKGFMAAMASVWDLQNRLSIQPVGDRFL